jgi:hypothetical protein
VRVWVWQSLFHVGIKYKHAETETEHHFLYDIQQSGMRPQRKKNNKHRGRQRQTLEVLVLSLSLSVCVRVRVCVSWAPRLGRCDGNLVRTSNTQQTWRAGG